MRDRDSYECPNHPQGHTKAADYMRTQKND